jgi:hypothetical protein
MSLFITLIKAKVFADHLTGFMKQKFKILVNLSSKYQKKA